MPEPTLNNHPQLTREQLANLRTVECSAVLDPVENLDGLGADEQVALAAVREAAGPPMITDGKPTIARVVAWMVHEGVNRNRQAFVKEELQAAASKIGLPAYPLVMDFNHAAIRRPEGAQRMVGVWYKADYAFDPKAKDGEGAWGILVQGIFFSWLFPEVANVLLAEQARNGKVDFSMACIASSVEFAKDAKGSYEILHNPTFFTNALLDVPPGDKDGHGMLEEGSGDPNLEQDMITKLCSAEAFKDALKLALAALQDTGGREDVMPNEVKPTIAFVHAVEQGKAVVTATVTMANAESEQALYSFELPKSSAELALEGQVADLTTALEAAKASGEQLTTQLADLQGAHDVLAARIADIDARAAQVAAAAKLDARKAELPEVYRAKHAAKPEAERTELEARWAAKSDEDWQEFVAMLADAVPAAPQVNTASYRARTLLEGTLVVPPSTTETKSISERVHKVLNS